ncbi:MAG: hypothetical protein ACMG6H_04445, partial [Acidobacteriota bacterium]
VQRIRAVSAAPNQLYRKRKATFVGASATRGSLAVTSESPLEIVLTELEAGYSALVPIPVSIEHVGDDYLASFNAANIHTTGETLMDAARNLRSLILDIFDSLVAERSALGPGPQRQLSTLLRYVKKDDPQ